MKFRLPPGTFPELELAREDMDNMENVASVLVDAAMADYEHHRGAARGFADRKRWKFVKHLGGVSMYEDRQVKQSAKLAANSSSIHALMAFGTTSGELEELMFGLLTLSREAMLAKSACTGDNLTDCADLASIVTPTPSNPLQSLQVKWSLIGEALPLLRAVVRPRDFVYLESTGIALDSRGEHVGFNLRHSVEVPGVRELKDCQIIRANMSFCRLFRQKRDGVIEVFMTGCVDARSPHICSSVVMMHIADALLSCRRLLLNARAKKLAWVLAHNKQRLLTTPMLTPTRRATQPAAAKETGWLGASWRTSAGNCSACRRRLGPAVLSRPRKCRVCTGLVCQHCCAPLNIVDLSVKDQDGPRRRNSTCVAEVRREKALVCLPCLRAVDRLSAMDVAVDEIRRVSPLLASESSVAMASGSSLLSLINSDRFDNDLFFVSQ